MICGSGGWKSRLAKAAGAELAGQMRDVQNVQNTPGPDHFWQLRCRKSARRCGAKHISKSKCTKHTSFGPLLEVAMSKKCTPLWREAHFEVKMYKAQQLRTPFGSCDFEKVHAVVARSTFRSQNGQSTPRSDHVWRFRCRKSGRRCGAKHISKSTCTKHTMLGPLLEVAMSKKCTPLWRKAHFEVKMFKTGHFWRFRCRFASLHYTTLHYTTGHYTTLHSSTLHYTTLHSITLHYTKLHYTTLHYTALRSTTLHYITFHYATLHSTTLHYTILHYLPLHFTTLHYTTLHYTTTTTTQLHSTTLHYTKLHYTKLHYTTLHYATLHYTTFRHTPLHHTTLHYTTLHWMTLHHR